MSVVFSEGASPSVVTMDADVLLSLSQDHRHTQQALIEELTRQRDELRGELGDYKRRLEAAEQRDRDAEAHMRLLEAQLARESALRTEVQRQRDEYLAERDELKTERDAYRQRHDQAEQHRHQAEARSQELATELARQKENDAGPLVPKTIVWSGGLYYGTVQDGKPHGSGVLRTLDGSRKVYEGDWMAGCRQGTGTAYWSNGGARKGQWASGQMVGEGRADKMPLGGGTTYTGPLLAGKPHGHGTSYHQNGNKLYEGQWENGQRYGILFDGQWNKGFAPEGTFYPSYSQQHDYGGPPAWVPSSMTPTYPYHTP